MPKFTYFSHTCLHKFSMIIVFSASIFETLDVYMYVTSSLIFFKHKRFFEFDSTVLNSSILSGSFCHFIGALMRFYEPKPRYGLSSFSLVLSLQYDCQAPLGRSRQ